MLTAAAPLIATDRLLTKQDYPPADQPFTVAWPTGSTQCWLYIERLGVDARMGLDVFKTLDGKTWDFSGGCAHDPQDDPGGDPPETGMVIVDNDTKNPLRQVKAVVTNSKVASFGVRVEFR